MADVSKYAPLLQGIRESAEMPETTAMRKTLLGQINNELQMGSQLTPEQARETEQAQRTADIARGIGGGTGSSAREAVYKALQGQKLLGQRQQKASSVLGQEYAAQADPFQSILGRLSNAGQATSRYAAGMNTPTQAGTPISSSAGLTGILNYGSNANSLGLQGTQYNNMLSYIPQLLSMYNS
jgi:hypothetical protein